MSENKEEKTKFYLAAEGFEIIDLAFYGALLLVVIYITVRFLIWQGKGKLVYVSVFYGFTSITVIARIVFLIT